jgi:DNA mismatch repair protein MutS2
MDTHALRVLEFDKIRERLAACAACSLGKRRARALRPSRDPAWIRERLKETTEAREALARYGVPPFGGLTDISELLQRAVVGSLLDGHELLGVADTLRAARRVRQYFEPAEDAVCRRLKAVAERLHENRELEEQIEQSIDDEGAVRDDATDELRALWRKQRATYDRVQEMLARILAREAAGSALQERLIVQRSGRYCLPVRASAQGQFSGLIHDRSDSGATVFMEPLELVGPGNELREAELAIEGEKRRVLEELSERVGWICDEMQGDLRLLGVLDFVFAKAALAGKLDASEPGLAERGTFHFVRARHPLLTGDVVPIDVWIGKDFDTLLVTGPNTGGKTVTLRTVGLLILMAQSGLHIPAGVGSETGVFDDLYADIGDEQSIEQSLSTFSSHMTQIIKVLHRLQARERRASGSVNAVVLLDELGAGTDPTEGSALARAILEELQALGARTLATTHYNELKTFAYAVKRMTNASVEFDVKTLRPTFRLLIGEPGTSNAFEIAQRLGLPREIARKARSLLDEGETAVADVIERMERTRRRLNTEVDLAAEEREELERLQREYAGKLEELSARRRQAFEEGFAEAREIVERADQQAREIIADLQRQPRQSRVTEQRRREVTELRRAVEGEAAAHEAREREAEEELSPPEPPYEAPEGEPVGVRSLGRDGVLLRRLDGERVLVEVGRMRIEVPTTDLTPPREPISDEHRALAEKLRIVKELSVPREINLIGLTVDEATLELEKYLDDAFLAGLETVRIIHGKGTGALRRGLHDYLRQHRHVRSFAVAERTEGGEGATVVRL